MKTRLCQHRNENNELISVIQQLTLKYFRTEKLFVASLSKFGSEFEVVLHKVWKSLVYRMNGLYIQILN